MKIEIFPTYRNQRIYLPKDYKNLVPGQVLFYIEDKVKKYAILIGWTDEKKFCILNSNNYNLLDFSLLNNYNLAKDFPNVRIGNQINWKDAISNQQVKSIISYELNKKIEIKYDNGGYDYLEDLFNYKDFLKVKCAECSF